MSALTILYSGDRLVPSWTRFEEDETVLSEGNYIIPLLWLAMFTKNNLHSYYDSDIESYLPWKRFVPYLSGEKSHCLSKLSANRTFLSSLSGTAHEYLDKWESYIESAKGKYLSIDLSELYFMDQQIKKLVINVLNGFSKPPKPDIASIINLCGAEYNKNHQELCPNGDKAIHYHLLGLNPKDNDFWN